MKGESFSRVSTVEAWPFELRFRGGPADVKGGPCKESPCGYTVCFLRFEEFFLEARKAFPKPQLAEAFPEKKLPVKTAFHVLPAFLNMVVLQNNRLAYGTSVTDAYAPPILNSESLYSKLPKPRLQILSPRR